MHTPPARLNEAAPEGISEDHRELMTAVARLRDAPDAATTLTLLERIAVQLRAHFTAEDDRDGLFDWLLAIDRTRAGDVEALRADHLRLLGLLDDLEPVVRSGRVGGAAQEQIAAFCDALVAHERSESALVHDVVG